MTLKWIGRGCLKKNETHMYRAFLPYIHVLDGIAYGSNGFCLRYGPAPFLADGCYTPGVQKLIEGVTPHQRMPAFLNESVSAYEEIELELDDRYSLECPTVLIQGQSFDLHALNKFLPPGPIDLYGAVTDTKLFGVCASGSFILMACR